MFIELSKYEILFHRLLLSYQSITTVVPNKF